MFSLSSQDKIEIQKNAARIELNRTQQKQKKSADLVASEDQYQSERNQLDGQKSFFESIKNASSSKISEKDKAGKSRSNNSKNSSKHYQNLTKRKRVKSKYSVIERMVAVILLLITILISYLVMFFS
jgi:cation transport ATPase